MLKNNKKVYKMNRKSKKQKKRSKLKKQSKNVRNFFFFILKQSLKFKKNNLLRGVNVWKQRKKNVLFENKV